MTYLDFDPVQLMRQALEHGLAKIAPPEQPKKRDRAKYMRDYRAKHRVPKPIGRKSETGLSDKGLGHAEYCRRWRKLRKLENAKLTDGGCETVLMDKKHETP